MNKAVAPVALPTIFEEGIMKGLKDWPRQKRANNGIKLQKSAKTKGKNLLTSKHRSSLRRLISMVDSKKRQSVLQYLRPEFKRYISRSLHPPRKSNIVRPLNSSKPTKCLPGAVSNQPKLKIENRPRQSEFLIGQTISRHLVKRSIHTKPLPRLPPFHCQKCGLTSKNLGVLENHICGKRMQEYKNVSQVVELGFRSRVKDSLAVLERVPRPQTFSLAKPKHRYADEDMGVPLERQCQQPKTLFEISWQNIQKLYGLDRNFARIKTALSAHSQPSTSSAADDHDYFQRKHSSSSVISDGPHSCPPNCMPKAIFIAFKQEMETTKESHHIEAEMISCLNGNAFFCQRCRRLFGRYADWDSHLQLPDIGEEDEKIDCAANADDLFEIQVNLGEHFPISGQPISRGRNEDVLQSNSHQKAKLSESANKWRCTKCSAKGFLTRPEFHSHLMKCAMLGKIEEKVEKMGKPRNGYINGKQSKGNSMMVKRNGIRLKK